MSKRFCRRFQFPVTLTKNSQVVQHAGQATKVEWIVWDFVDQSFEQVLGRFQLAFCAGKIIRIQQRLPQSIAGGSEIKLVGDNSRGVASNLLLDLDRLSKEVDCFPC